jgi:hypothetical protein
MIQPQLEDKELCDHYPNTSTYCDYVQCNDCTWITPGGNNDAQPNNGWFPSMEAFKEWKKYKFYPGMDVVKPTRRKRAYQETNVPQPNASHRPVPSCTMCDDSGYISPTQPCMCTY